MVRKDVEQIDRIVRENVERAVRAKDKQLQELMLRLREQAEKMQQLETHKECFATSIKALEAQVESL
jgi:succinate dehydrogenase/fumarate reductase flavoprotein subunit